MKDLATRIQNGDIDIQSSNYSESIDLESEIPSSTQAISISSEYLGRVGVVSLSEWFLQNHSNFNSVNRVGIQIRGVNSDEDLVFAVLDPSGGTDRNNHPKRKLRVWNNAHLFAVLDLPGIDMNVFSNGLKIIYNYQDVIIKCYGAKAGLHIVFCKEITNRIIPYATTKMKKRESGIHVIIPPNSEQVAQKFNEAVNMEDLILQYPQLTKINHSIVTINDMINWFIERQNETYDINHLLQIDKLIIWALFG